MTRTCLMWGHTYPCSPIIRLSQHGNYFLTKCTVGQAAACSYNVWAWVLQRKHNHAWWKLVPDYYAHYLCMFLLHGISLSLLPTMAVCLIYLTEISGDCQAWCGEIITSSRYQFWMEEKKKKKKKKTEKKKKKKKKTDIVIVNNIQADIIWYKNISKLNCPHLKVWLH